MNRPPFPPPAKRPTWIWYPGDFELWLSNRVQARRTERHCVVPPFWRMDSHHVKVSFIKEVNFTQPQAIRILAEGQFNVAVDEAYWPISDGLATLPAGPHVITVTIFNTESVPALWVEGDSLASDMSWRASLTRKPLSMENTYADGGEFLASDRPPSAFKLPTEPRQPRSVSESASGVLVDFGEETFGYIVIHKLRGEGSVLICYGESEEEALSPKTCETYDRATTQPEDAAESVTLPVARAFRYVSVHGEGAVSFAGVSMRYEYASVEARGRFTCSNDRLNTIWRVSLHTLRLNTREFFLDGIKRDRWLWSGDAVQEYLMNYYTFFDQTIVRRTTWALRGGEPVEQHLNSIIDYSFYWFIGVRDYYLYTGDSAFLEQIYPRMVTLMSFCLRRRNSNGFVEELPGDWLFLDWADFPKTGEVCAEQLLFCRSLESIAECAQAIGKAEESAEYKSLARQLHDKILHAFWDTKKGVLIHHREGGEAKSVVTRYANMFAILYNFLPSSYHKSAIANGVLSEDLPKITTPYMRFYELEALCSVGMQEKVTQQILDYWGGMLDHGATSFWELYDPREEGNAQYAMYGRPFGKSLCHAWGASPVYLIGKYYLGVQPITPGYSTYLVEPRLGGLEWIEGAVPTPRGEIQLRFSRTEIKLRAFAGGTLRFQSTTKPSCSVTAIIETGQGEYELTIVDPQELAIHYTAP